MTNILAMPLPLIFNKKETIQIFSRPKIRTMSPTAFQSAYYSQPQNSSAKIALIVDEYFTMFATLTNKIRAPNWNRLDNTVVYTFHDTFVFIGTSFYFRMFDKMIDKFIPTGIMQHLIDNYFFKKLIFEDTEEDQKELTLADLAFGFNIWLVACFLSLLGFIAEHILALKNKRKQIFAAVHPINSKPDHEISINRININPELIKMFRVKKHAPIEEIRIVSTAD